jgi:hypothetical protein
VSLPPYHFPNTTLKVSWVLLLFPCFVVSKQGPNWELGFFIGECAFYLLVLRVLLYQLSSEIIRLRVYLMDWDVAQWKSACPVCVRLWVWSPAPWEKKSTKFLRFHLSAFKMYLLFCFRGLLSIRIIKLLFYGRLMHLFLS